MSQIRDGAITRYRMADNRLRWDDIEIFCLLAERGSLRQAASQCGQSVETVRRRVNALEVSLGERLFRRTAQGLAITQAGEEILGEARRARDAVLSISRIAGADHPRSPRRIRICVPEDLGALWLAPALHRALNASSTCVIECEFQAPGADPDWTKTDIALLFEKPLNAELICRKIGSLRYGLFTGRRCAGAFEPADDEERFNHAPLLLPGDRHPYIARLSSSERWAGRVDRAVMRLESAACRLDILMATDAVTVLPAVGIATEPEVHCLPESLAPRLAVDLWAVFHDDVRRGDMARAVLDVIVSLVSKNPDLCLDAQRVVA